MTLNDVLDAVIRSSDATLDTEGPTYHGPAFRTWPATLGCFDGHPVLMTECEEMVDGRWEGFVSFRRIRPLLWEEVTG